MSNKNYSIPSMNPWNTITELSPYSIVHPSLNSTSEPVIGKSILPEEYQRGSEPKRSIDDAL